MLRMIFTFLALISFSATASAQICVKIDEEKDGLEESVRSSAVVALSEAFRAEGLEVVNTPCPNTYSLYHRPFGKSVIVFVSGELGNRMLQAASIEVLMDVYEEIARSLVRGDTAQAPLKAPEKKETKAKEQLAEPNSEPNQPKRLNSITGEYSLLQMFFWRYGRLLNNEKTEVHAALGQAVIEGCAMSPKCEHGFAVKAGARHYFSTGRTSLFVESHLNYLAEGFRFSRQESVIADLGAGLIRRSENRKFSFGVGGIVYGYDKEDSGLNIDSSYGILVELGGSF